MIFFATCCRSLILFFSLS
uniref:Uncharacterized protein n=1 Tax=Arundo donax TaxID=35708 RepID=A0A0A8ZYV3_ARUDO